MRRLGRADIEPVGRVRRHHKLDRAARTLREFAGQDELLDVAARKPPGFGRQRRGSDLVLAYRRLGETPRRAAVEQAAARKGRVTVVPQGQIFAY